jgi:hypothetical protein
MHQKVRILCGLEEDEEEEELRAFVYVDILPVVDWDNTRGGRSGLLCV